MICLTTLTLGQFVQSVYPPHHDSTLFDWAYRHDMHLTDNSALATDAHRDLVAHTFVVQFKALVYCTDLWPFNLVVCGVAAALECVEARVA